MKGIFLGWDFNLGEAWNKRYKVIPLSGLDRVSFLIEALAQDCRVRIQSVAEVKPVFKEDDVAGRHFVFPCQERYFAANGTLEGRAQALLDLAAGENHPLPDHDREVEDLGTDVSHRQDMLDVIPLAVSGWSDQPPSLPAESGNVDGYQKEVEVEEKDNVVRVEDPSAREEPVSYLTSGHRVLRSKTEGARVNQRPDGIPSGVWSSTGPVGRLKLLNEFRKGRKLRTASSWEEMNLFLIEEHAPFLAPPGHVFPWGGRGRCFEHRIQRY